MCPIAEAVSSGVDESLRVKIEEYLSRYGFSSNAVMVNAEISIGSRFDEALWRFQQFYMLNEGGPELARTLEIMMRPRCDVQDLSEARRLLGCRWPPEQQVLVYDFGQLTTDIAPPELVKKAVNEAIVIWNAVLKELQISLRFREPLEQDEPVQVNFAWQTGLPDIPFAGTPIAHADFPPACSVVENGLPKPVRFSDDRDWSDEDEPGKFNIISVAVHEIGHILGLPHNPNQNSVMFAAPRNISVPTQTDKDFLKALYT